MSQSSSPSAAILGCSGPELTSDERKFFADAKPFGLILFARNIAAPEVVRRLASDFREVVGRPDAPVLIDQEGGRVARLRPPIWPSLPAAGQIGALWKRDREKGLAAAQLQGLAIAATLAPLGIDVACAPMCDVAAPDADAKVIGDRAYGDSPRQVAELAAATELALRSAGIATTPKHAPGHGRATSDSHYQLPKVEASLAEIVSDLIPFRAMLNAPFFMTAHIVFSEIDPNTPATCSRKCLDWLRAETGFAGAILSDDLAMKALTGPIQERAKSAISAGCDALLYCSGDMSGNIAAIKGAGTAGVRLQDTWRKWTSSRPTPIHKDAFVLAAELWAMIREGEI